LDGPRAEHQNHIKQLAPRARTLPQVTGCSLPCAARHRDSREGGAKAARKRHTAGDGREQLRGRWLTRARGEVLLCLHLSSLPRAVVSSEQEAPVSFESTAHPRTVSSSGSCRAPSRAVQAGQAQLGPSANGREQAGIEEGALPGAYALVRHVNERTCHAAGQ